MSKINFPGNPNNGASHRWNRRRRFNYSSSKGGWQAKGATPPTPTAPTLNASTDLQDMNDATGLAARMRGMAVMYNSYSDFPTEAYTGTFAYTRDTNELYVWTGASPVPSIWYGDRGVHINQGIDYFDINTPGSAAAFDVLPTNVGTALSSSAESNGTIGVCLGLYTTAYTEDLWFYWNFASTGSAAEIGPLRADEQSHASASDATRAVFEFDNTVVTTNNMDYVTIATSGTSSVFGEMYGAGYRRGGTGDGTYGLFAGGRGSTGNGETHLSYFTIQTVGNASDFGFTLLEGRYKLAGASDGTRAFFGGGSTNRNSAFQAYSNIETTTIATPASCTNFGNLGSGKNGPTACHNDTRMVFSGGDTSGRGVNPTNTQDYFTMGTTGSATSFGNLVQTANYWGSGTSGYAA